MKKTVISEQTIRDHLQRGSRSLTIPMDAIVTDLATELAASRGLAIVREKAHTAGSVSPVPVAPSIAMGLRVAIGSDHGGFALKKSLIEFLSALGVVVTDVGTKSEEPCDYPDYAFQVAQTVVGRKADLGIMIDGAGIGSCMVVNKVPGVRGACCSHEFTARNAREHNNANILTLGSRVVGLEVAKAVVRVFLEAPFAGGRHEVRVGKIMDIEKKSLR
jgi:ribose 5-phosphate isomerase B